MQVLVFIGFYHEARAPPGFEIRKVSLYYFIEDGSVRLCEDGRNLVSMGFVTNGELVKRHKIPKTPNSTDFFTEIDFYCGAHVNIYGKKITLFDCNSFTRLWLQQRGRPSDSIPIPDQYIHNLEVTRQKEFDTSESHGRVAIMTGRSPSRTALARMCPFPVIAAANPIVANNWTEPISKFYDMDRKVLRFLCTWQDNSMYGQNKRFVVNYFLVDDTVEILDVHSRNDGTDKWAKMLRRQPLLKELPRNILVVKHDETELRPQPRYHWTELKIGATVNVFGRDFVIRDCDDFTRKWYETHTSRGSLANGIVCKPQSDALPLSVDDDCEDEEGFQFPGDIAAALSRPSTASVTRPMTATSTFSSTRASSPSPARRIPKSVGYGSQDDSLGSVFNLQPKVPRQNILRKKEWSQKAMRFKAKLLNTGEENDKDREFVLSVYLADDTIMIFETNRANSGFWGGKFLERSLVAKPKSPDSEEPLEEYYACEDFYVGSVVVLNTFTLGLIDCDAFTRSILEGAPNLDVEGQLLLRQVRGCLKNAGLSNRERFSFCNYLQNGEISQSEMIKALRLLGVALSMVESKRLLFMYDDDNRCSKSELCFCLCEMLALLLLLANVFSLLSSGTLNFAEFVNMFTDYGKITSSSPARKEQVPKQQSNIYCYVPFCVIGTHPETAHWKSPAPHCHFAVNTITIFCLFSRKYENKNLVPLMPCLACVNADIG